MKNNDIPNFAIETARNLANLAAMNVGHMRRASTDSCREYYRGKVSAYSLAAKHAYRMAKIAS